MDSVIYPATVRHHRQAPRTHGFSYPITMYGVFLDELPELDAAVPGFGHNRRAPVSLFDTDYLTPAGGSIRERLQAVLGERGFDAPVARVLLVTAPRLLLPVFNPVSFHFLFDEAGGVVGMVAEVNNTFGQRHVYVLRPETADGRMTAATRKRFHVSPFNDMSGTYRFTVGDPRTRLSISIALERDGQTVFTASITADPVALTGKNLRRHSLAHPLRPHLSMARIAWQALQLWARRRLPVHRLPAASSPDTVIASTPGMVDRLRRRLVFRVFSRIRTGRLTVVLPDGERRVFGGENGREGGVRVRDERFFRRIVAGGDVGLAESYMHGEWDTDDLTAAIAVFAENLDEISHGRLFSAAAARLSHFVTHLRRRNTVRRSKDNIREHYDVSNDFYRLFLDDSMTYSAGMYPAGGETLAEAQHHKRLRLMELAGITADDHVLEIGCGWGSFAIDAARTTGCRVTGITISRSQYRLARQKVREAGLEGRVRILLKDYRHMTGSFDKIVSIEMLEAVGERFYGTFFSTVDRLLAPDGVAVLQVITIPDFRFSAHRREIDFMQKHIFPGGLLPSLTALSSAMTKRSRLIIERVENIGVHYARTLAQWNENFAAARDEVRALGFDDVFIRKWEYYFSYCAAGFETRTINDLHIVLTRQNNRNLPGIGSPEADGAVVQGR